MKQKPQTKLTLLNTYDIRYILLIGISSTVLVLGVFWWWYQQDGTVAYTAAFSVLALIQSFIFIDIWLSKRNVFTNLPKLLSSVFFLAFAVPFITQYGIIRIESLAQLFKITTVSNQHYLFFAAGASLILAAIMLWKPLLKQKAQEER